jgi:serine/threonine protein kinase
VRMLRGELLRHALELRARAAPGPVGYSGPMPLEAGARAGGKYRLVRPLASGGMGQVWLARSETTGADVALKVLHDARSGTLEARFRKEARFGAGLSHRNIVRTFDFIEEADGTLVLVMELLRGESLGQFLERRGALTTAEALAVALPILSALGHAHASGVVHRDVTPANVFLAVEPDGEVLPKLVDFGIAKLPGGASLTLEGAVLGTPRYMSPEQIRAASDIDGRADLFGVAVIVYEMITGVSPFDGPTPAASLAAVLEATVDPDPRIEPRVWVELQRALSKRPYQRHKDAQELAGALRAAIGETDAALASLLRREPPEQQEVSGPSEPQGASTGTVDGQSLDAAPRGRVPRRVVVGAGAAVLVLAGVLLGSSVRRADRATPAAGAPAPGRAEAIASPPPSVVASPAEQPPEPPAPSATGSQARPARLPVHPPLAHPRPVATTPGF